MTILNILTLLAGLVLIVCGCVAGAVAVRLIRSSKSEYDRNRNRSGSFSRVLNGRLQTALDGKRDYKVGAGVGWDVKKNIWVEQGIVSTEAINELLRK